MTWPHHFITTNLYTDVFWMLEERSDPPQDSGDGDPFACLMIDHSMAVAEIAQLDRLD